MTRVLFICSHLRLGGAQRQWWLLISSLADRGWEPYLLALEHEGELFHDLGERGIDLLCTGMRGRLDLPAVNRAISAARRFAPAVVVTHGVRAQVVGDLVARRCGVSHVTADHRAPGFPFKPHRELIVRAVAPRVARIVAVTRRQIPQIVRRRYRREAIRVIPNGVSRDRLVARHTRDDMRAELGVPQGSFVALTIAVLRPEKRIGSFVRAIRWARQERPNVHGVVAGSGPELGAVRRAADEVGGAVFVLGQRLDVGDLLTASDAVCLSSAFEAASMAALEAMAFSLPVVVTNVGGMDEIVSDGVTGLLVPPDDEVALGHSLAALAADPARARSLGQSGRARQERDFSLTRMIEGYEGVLHEVVG